jgi:hypothetical protein
MSETFGNKCCGYSFAQQRGSPRMTGNVGGDICFDTMPSRNSFHIGIDAADGI